MNAKMTVDRDALFLYFSGRLEPERMHALMEWACASEENRKTLLRERRIYDAILLADDRVFDRTPARRRRRPARGTAFRFAFALVLLAVILPALKMFTDVFPDKTVAMNSISVPAGERARVVLPDGTAVWLNSGTMLCYPSDFERRKKREVTLDGQANLDVAPDAKHPFIVHTYLADIEVHGTVFDVNAEEQNGIFETSLFEGKVSVRHPRRPDAPIVLRPAKKLTLREDKLWISDIDDYDVYKWTEGLYCFRNKRFSEIIGDLQRYYGKQILYEPDPALEKETLSGKFRIRDGLDYSLQILQTNLPFNYSRDQENNQIFITSR